MNKPDPIESVVDRTQRYWFVDGLTELAFGGAMLLAALYYGAASLVGKPVSDFALGIGQPILVVVGYLSAKRIVHSLKERVTYPRTGYVGFAKPDGVNRALSFTTSLILAAGLARSFRFLAQQANVSLGPAVAGAAVAVGLAAVGIRIGLTRFFVLAVGAGALGVYISWLRLPWPSNAAFLLAGLGLGACLSGGFTLRHYLLTTEPFGEEETL